MTEYNVQQIEWCSNCEQDICRSCAIETLEDSHYGQLLRANVKARYSAWHWEDLDRFIEHMGPDVDPVLHGAHQAEAIVKPFVEMQNASGYGAFSKDQAKLLYVTNLYHDSHEGITGDIPKPLKTPETDAEELRINKEVVMHLTGWDDDSPLLAGMQEIMGDVDGTTYLGRAFDAIERAGYLQTGLRAWSMRNHVSLSFAERFQAAKMGQIVSLDAAEHLRRFVGEFAYADYLLRTSAPALAEMS